MFSDERLSQADSEPSKQHVSSPIETLLQDAIRLRILVVLKVCEARDAAFLTRMMNEERGSQPLVADVGGELFWLEQQGYIIARRSSGRLFWSRPFETPSYSITPSGKAALAEVLGLLNKSIPQFPSSSLS